MQLCAVRFFGGCKAHWKKISLILAGVLVLVVGLFVLAPDVSAAGAVLQDGNMTFDGRSFSGPSRAENDQIIPTGSVYYLEDTGVSATQRRIIYSDREFGVGDEVILGVWGYTGSNNTYSARPLSTELILISDGSGRTSGQDLSCTAQIGAIGWILCPTTSFLAKAADSLFGMLSGLLVVDPIYNDDSSPIYIVWQYMRNLANVVFVIFMLIVILSQITNLGISNYGVKKVLPKMVIAIVLVNLSYLICAVAVDLSNVIGVSLKDVFVMLQERAMERGVGTTINLDAGAGFVQILGITTGGAIAVGAALTYTGLAGALLFLVPVLVGALIAIFAALITLAARQALIICLVAVAPLAFVTYLLPNTEKLFKKWRELLMRMLIIFPAFSLIFGVSRLAGWMIITSSENNVPRIILGMAVQVIPLAVTPILMKLSGSLLNSIGEFAKKPFAPAQKALAGWSEDRRAMERAKMLGKTRPRAPYARLAQWLDGNKRHRADLKSKYEEMAKGKYDRREQDKLGEEEARAKGGSALEDWRRERKIQRRQQEAHEARLRRERTFLQKATRQESRRSLLERAEQAKMNSKDAETYSAGYLARQKNDYEEVEYDEVLADGTIAKKKIKRARSELAQAHLASSALQYGKEVEEKKLEVLTGEMGDNYASNSTLIGASDDVIRMQEIARQKYQSFLLDNSLRERKALGDRADRKAYADAVAEAQAAGPDSPIYKQLIMDATVAGAGSQEHITSVVANSVTAIAKDNQEATANYTTLYNEVKYTEHIRDALTEAFGTKNANSMEGAIEVMVKRGDVDMVQEEILKATADGTMDEETSKRLTDKLLTLKADAAHLWAYGKSIKIRAAKALKNGEDPAASFVSLEEFAKDDGADGMQSIIKNITDPGIVKSQDRTEFSSLIDLIKIGALDGTSDGLGFQMKQLRSAAVSGQIDGEVLGNLNRLVLGGADKQGVPFNQVIARQNIKEFLEPMAAVQLAGMKESTFSTFNDALGGDYKNGVIHDKMKEWLSVAAADLEKSNNAAMLGSMNTNIRKFLDLNDRGA